MKTVKLHWIQTLENDPFTKDTYVIENSGFNVGEFSYVHDAVEFTLPEGYSVSETKSGETAIFDSNHNYCCLDRYNKRPRLISPQGVVFLKEAATP